MQNKNTDVDARGQSCPIPVLMTKKALEAASMPASLSVLVDNAYAVENITRFAQSNGYQAKSRQNGELEYLLELTKA